MTQGVELSPTNILVQTALTVIGFSGIVLSFVPFVDGFKPFTDILLGGVFFGDPIWFLDPLWLLAAPCIILPAPISMGYVLRLITGRLPRWALVMSYILSAWLVISSLVALICVANDGKVSLEWLLLIFLTGAAYVGGLWLSIQGIRHDSIVRGPVLMQSVYVAPMTYWVVGFGFGGSIEYTSVGTWLGAITLLTYLVQIALAAKRIAWAMAVVVPTACIAILSAVGTIAP